MTRARLALLLALAACGGGGDGDERAGREGGAPPPATAPSALPSAAASAAPGATADAEPSADRTPAPSPFGRLPRTAEPNEFLAAAEREAIQSAIRAQIEALRRDDGRTAFSLAAPVIREMFGTPEQFLLMVRSAYAPLYRPRDVRFGETTIVAGEITQKVVVIDREGRPVVALYLMDRQPDGAWKIMGCILVPSGETPA